MLPPTEQTCLRGGRKKLETAVKIKHPLKRQADSSLILRRLRRHDAGVMEYLFDPVFRSNDSNNTHSGTAFGADVEGKRLRTLPHFSGRRSIVYFYPLESPAGITNPNSHP